MGDLHNGWFIVANPVKMDYCILLCFFKLLNCWFSWFPQYRRWSFVAFVFFMYIYSACIVASCYRLLPIRWSKESAMFVGMFAKQWHIHIYIYMESRNPPISMNIYEILGFVWNQKWPWQILTAWRPHRWMVDLAAEVSIEATPKSSRSNHPAIGVPPV